MEDLFKGTGCCHEKREGALTQGRVFLSPTIKLPWFIDPLESTMAFQKHPALLFLPLLWQSSAVSALPHSLTSTIPDLLKRDASPNRDNSFGVGNIITIVLVSMTILSTTIFIYMGQPCCQSQRTAETVDSVPGHSPTSTSTGMPQEPPPAYAPSADGTNGPK